VKSVRGAEDTVVEAAAVAAVMVVEAEVEVVEDTAVEEAVVAIDPR
jgi:hypothetical protein